MSIRIPVKWQVYPENKALNQRLSEALACSEIVAQLLLNRGIRSLADAQAFLSPKDARDAIDFDTEGMRIGSECLDKHIREKSRIFIVGDYDVDGVSSTAMLVGMLRKMGAEVAYRLPHRFTEGYGLSMAAIDVVIREQCGLLITLDCGISNRKEIERLRSEIDCDVIIVDHHTIPAQLPDATALIHPKQLPEDHASYQLCTAGVVFRWIAYLKERFSYELNLDDYLGLAALGTVADVVPLVGDNRVLAASGLAVLSRREHLGLAQLLEVAHCDVPTLSARDLGFVIGPRLNAAGRMAHAQTGVDLLLSATATTARDLAVELDGLNQKRRQLGETMLNDASFQIAKNPNVLDYPVLVMADEGWHSGIIGITASRLVAEHKRPVLLMAYDGDVIRGSARSVPGVDVYHLISQCSGYLATFGGHFMAAGFSLSPSELPAFISAIQEESTRLIAVEDLAHRVDIDTEISISDISMDFAEEIQALAPFGEGNPEPVFYISDMRCVESRLVGNGSHLKVTFSDAEGGIYVDGIGFGMGEKRAVLYKDRVDVLCQVGINEWQGQRSVQLQLIDLK